MGLDDGEAITAFNPFDDMPDLPVTPIEDNPINQLPLPKHTHHDEARDWYVESYPRPAGIPNSSQKLDTEFETERLEQQQHGKPQWDPFTGKVEWKLAKWLLNEVSQKATDCFLKLPNVQDLNLSFHNNYTFLRKIDSLPTSPDWICEQMTVEGDLLDGGGE